LTCIIGVVCEDGIVLIGDTKVKIGERASYEKKIIPVEGYENLVVAAAGLLDIRNMFIEDIKNLPTLIKQGIIKVDPVRGFRGVSEDISRRLWEIYSSRYDDYKYNSAFRAFVCQKPITGKPLLFKISEMGTSTQVREYDIIGTGEQYAHLFLKPPYTGNANMYGVAIIATFIIILIDKYKIDETIGIEEGGSVQIWKFPNNGRSYEVNGSELDDIMNEARERLEKFGVYMITGNPKLD